MRSHGRRVGAAVRQTEAAEAHLATCLRQAHCLETSLQLHYSRTDFLDDQLLLVISLGLIDAAIPCGMDARGVWQCMACTESMACVEPPLHF